MGQLSNRTSLKRVLNAVAAGTTTQTSSAVDLAGYQGVRFIVALGAITATGVPAVKASDCDTSGGTYADIAGSLGTAFTASTDDNKLWVLDIYRPTKRFLKCIVTRATANAVIDGVWAELYEGRVQPATDDTTVLGHKLLVSPVDGTA
jgi:hypothetical protein